jgi:Zinc finger, C2H2 type
MNETLNDHSFMTILAKMAVLKQCTVCGRTFANKSNFNRHHASVHMKKRKKINVHEDFNEKDDGRRSSHTDTQQNAVEYRTTSD